MPLTSLHYSQCSKCTDRSWSLRMLLFESEADCQPP